MHKNDCHTVVVELRSTRATHHLENVCNKHPPAHKYESYNMMGARTCNRKVDVTTRFSVKVLSSLDDDEMGGEVDAPRKRARCDENL